MNEEIKRVGELNEKALEDVSGGEAGPIGPVPMARNACSGCGRKVKCSHFGTTDLVNYLWEHRDVNLTNCMYCPYYNDAKQERRS